jgi:hypothetical protein
MPGLDWTLILLPVPPIKLGITGTYHGTQPLVEMRSHDLFTQAVLKP